MLYHLLYPLHETFSVFNVFKYITFRVFAAALTALFLSFVLGPIFIRVLSVKKGGQWIREDGPPAHHQKAGTQTMGGLLILCGLILSVLKIKKFRGAGIW